MAPKYLAASEVLPTVFIRTGSPAVSHSEFSSLAPYSTAPGRVARAAATACRRQALIAAWVVMLDVGGCRLR